MTKETDRTITLRSYADITEAQMMQDKLKENGIDAFIHDDNVMGMDPVAGVELKIFEKDREAAEKVLATG